MLKPEVSLIIVNYNTAKEIKNCLNSVLSSQFSVHDVEVIVVDNASSDDSAQVIRRFRNVKLIQNKENLGFAAANNIGAREAKGDFLFFLNPDTQIKRDTILKLIGFTKKNPAAIVGPRLLNPDGSLQGSCYNLPTIAGVICEYWFGKKGSYEKFTPKTNKPNEVEAVVGAAMFMSKATFEKLDGFDERYFLYYEDLDFCRKAAKLNIPIYYYPNSVVVHFLGKAGGNLKDLAKSAQIYHGKLRYLLLTLIIKIGLWLRS